MISYVLDKHQVFQFQCIRQAIDEDKTLDTLCYRLQH